jgi:Ni,Fe-hydrogenase III small subunit
VQRLGIYFTASPRHADVLLVSGLGALGMIGPLQHTYEVMPHPKVVIAAGVDAISGGLLHSSYATIAGISSSVPVDVFVPGSPPSPFGLLHGILMAVNLLAPRRADAARTFTARSVDSPESSDS